MVVDFVATLHDSSGIEFFVQPLLNKFCPLADIIIPNKNDDFKGKFFYESIKVIKSPLRKADKIFFTLLFFRSGGGEKKAWLRGHSMQIQRLD